MKYVPDPNLTLLSSSLSHSSAECNVYTRIEAYTCKATTKDKKLWKAIDEHFEEELSALNDPNSMQMPPEYGSPLDSAFGPLDGRRSRRTYFLLVNLLNVAFPDYDFSNVNPDHFTREPNGGVPVLTSLSNTFASLRDSPASSRNDGKYFTSRSYSSFPITNNAEDIFPKRVSSSASSSPILRPTSNLTSLMMRNAPPVIANTHPTLFRILNGVVTLSECEVYSYNPDPASDPHAGSDGDSDSEGVLDSDNGEDDFSDSDSIFEQGLDDYYDGAAFYHPFTAKQRDSSSSDGSRTSSSYSGSPIRSVPIRAPVFHKRRSSNGGLLWSSYWFFFHKKEKKILFISVWARGRKHRSSYLSTAEEEFEVFEAWEGAVGAGKRAFEEQLGERKAKVSIF
ncbi:Maf1 regulator-domain-containing protein [Cantharellus anzutake]|uniref:Maf1 regulator-domain-containing protein n=1 Tax=Cantharellus anzutake TaxID=1750568 RepID=UPI0019031C64|nr:Maf1 regulator-domain-containing protein [Cantharellus anzutake]KAF8339829.1 Maf1 regulator-domain-containing protein [Cantharellus anzutake]